MTNSSGRNRRHSNPIAYTTLEQRRLLAADVAPSVDIYPDFLPDSSNPTDLVESGGVVFFTASTPTTGTELWKTDGTEAGTVLVKDIRVGRDWSSPTNLTNVNGTLFFQANDGINGAELWKSDGTEAGTVLVADSRPGIYGLSPSQLINFNGELIFVGYNNGNPALWKSDGTAEGTAAFKGLSVSGGKFLTQVGDHLFYSNSGGGRRALWKTDGTFEGSEMVSEVDPGNANDFTDVGGTLFFIGDDRENGRELWKSDGTDAGTVMVKDIGASSLGELTNVDGTLYFATRNGLWKSNGTEEGTVEIDGSFIRPSDLITVNGELFFRGNQSSSDGSELWKSDGTEEGTVLLRSLNGSGGGPPENLTDVNGTLYFHAYNRSFGYGLWKSDGTTVGTLRVKDIAPDDRTSVPSEMLNWNGTLLFPADDLVHGVELWKSDGTEEGTSLLKDIDTGAADSFPNSFHTRNRNTIFAADAADGRTLWNLDGADNTISSLPITLDGRFGNGPIEFVNLNGTDFFFTARNFLIELWKTDGTDAGTELVKAISVDSEAYLNFTGLTNVDGTLFFRAGQGELWKSDGAEAGTVLVRSFYAIGELTEYQGSLFFRAAPNTAGAQLWKSDGTEAGTVVAADVSSPLSLTKMGDSLFFTASASTFSKQLWKTDGTTAGTELLYQGSSSIGELTAANERLFFMANTGGVSNWWLWSTDGTTDGTQSVKEGFLSPPRDLIDVDGTVYFAAQDGDRNYGSELWKSDGTEAGTNLVQDIRPGIIGSEPSDLTNVNGVLYFQANDGISGEELWRVDGEGVSLAWDIAAGTAGSLPQSLATDGQTLYFSAQTDSFGRETYAVNVPSMLALSSSSVQENSGTSAPIGTFGTTDLDEGETHTYSFVGGSGDTDNAKFEIIGNTLQAAISFNFEAQSSYSIRVRTTDSAGFFAEKSFTISVLDAPEMIGSAIVGDGSNLPSEVNQIVLTFDRDVDVAPEAFEITKLDSLGRTVDIYFEQIVNSQEQTEVTLSFSGPLTQEPYGNLAAGYYQLTVDRTKITSDGVAIDVDQNPGEDYVAQLYAALLGDANLDGMVDILGDAFALVSNLGQTSGASWEDGDFNGDGRVDVLNDAFALVGNLGRDVRPPAAAFAAQSTASNSFSSSLSLATVHTTQPIFAAESVKRAKPVPVLPRDDWSVPSDALFAEDFADQTIADDDEELELAGSYDSVDATFGSDDW